METMNVDADTIRKLREERAWSQEHLAAVAGLSLRTVQRVESEANASAETRMSLATAFGVDLAQLSPSIPVQPPPSSAPPSTPQPEVVSSGPRDTTPPLSYWHYRVLRFVVIVGLIVGFDVYQTGSITWSRWVLVFGIALFVLRVIRMQFVGPRPLRRRRSDERHD